MVITTTAIAFILSSSGLAFCGLRFFGAFQKIGDQQSRSKIGVLLSTAFLGTALQHGILGWGNLFFAPDSEMLFRVLLVDNIVLTLVTALEVYLFFHLFYPRTSPRSSIIASLALGMLVIFLLLATHSLPFITGDGGIEWNMSPQVEILLSLLLFVNIGTLLYIFAKSYRQTNSREVKIVSFVVVMITGAGILNVFTRFMFLIGTAPDMRALIFDITLVLIGIVSIVAFLPSSVVIRWFGKLQRNKSNKKDMGLL